MSDQTTSIYIETLRTCIDRIDNCDPVVDLEDMKHAVIDALENVASELAWHRRILGTFAKSGTYYDDSWSGATAPPQAPRPAASSEPSSG